MQKIESLKIKSFINQIEKNESLKIIKKHHERLKNQIFKDNHCTGVAVKKVKSIKIKKVLTCLYCV